MAPMADGHVRSASVPCQTHPVVMACARRRRWSEVFAVLHDLRCGIVDARAWTHGGRVAALVFVHDEETGASIDDAARVRRIESRLRHVLRGGARGARTVVFADAAAVDMYRRLHQLLNEDGEAVTCAGQADEAPSTTAVAVQDWGERGYSVVTVSCRDRQSQAAHAATQEREEERNKRRE